MRVIIAAIVGGIVIFIWGVVAHVLLPLGAAGITAAPNEETLVTAMKSSLTEPGLYFIPGMENMQSPTPEDQAAWQEKYEAGPRAILVYQPTGASPLSPRQMGIEFASGLFAALLLSIVLSRTLGSYGRRVIVAALIGIFAWASIHASFWNWYGFPDDFTIAALLDEAIGWMLVGLAVAAIVPQAPSAAPAA